MGSLLISILGMAFVLVTSYVANLLGFPNAFNMILFPLLLGLSSFVIAKIRVKKIKLLYTPLAYSIFLPILHLGASSEKNLTFLQQLPLFLPILTIPFFYRFGMQVGEGKIGQSTTP